MGKIRAVLELDCVKLSTGEIKRRIAVAIASTVQPFYLIIFCNIGNLVDSAPSLRVERFNKLNRRVPALPQKSHEQWAKPSWEYAKPFWE